MSCSTVWERKQLKEGRACSASLVEPDVFTRLQIWRNVVQPWSVRASAVVCTHGGASEENPAEGKPSAVGQRYLGCLLTPTAPFYLQEHYGSLLPEGLQQRPGTGVQPWTEARQRWCQGECSTHMQMVSLTAAEGRRAKCEPSTLTSCRKECHRGSFIVMSVDLPVGSDSAWKRTNSNYGAIFLPYSPLSIIPNPLLFLFHFFCLCECNQTKPLAELFPQALLPKSTSLILLTL